MSYRREREVTLETVDNITDKINATVDQLLQDKSDKDTKYDEFIEIIKKGNAELLKDDLQRCNYIEELECGPARKVMYISINFVPEDTILQKDANKKSKNSKIAEHIKRLSKRFDMFLAAIENLDGMPKDKMLFAIKVTRRKLLRLYNKLYAVDSNRLEEILIRMMLALIEVISKMTAFVGKVAREEDELQARKGPQ